MDTDIVQVEQKAQRKAYPSGTAAIKPEYLVSSSSVETKPQVDDDAAEGGSSSAFRRGGTDPRDEQQANGEAGGRPQRTGKWSKEQKKAQRGQNKGRRFGKVRDEFDLCWKVANGALCEIGAEKCRFSHDIASYLSSKPPDLHIPSIDTISLTPPYAPDQASLRHPHPTYPTLDTSTTCPVFQETGECRYGFKCRFLGGHVKISEEEGDSEKKLALALVGDEDKKAHSALTAHELNFVSAEVQKQLRSKKYPTPVADAYLSEIGAGESWNAESMANGGWKNKKNKNKANHAQITTAEDGAMVVAEPEQEFDDEPTQAVPDINKEDEEREDVDMDVDELITKRTGDSSGPETQKDSPDARVRFSEKKRLHWTGKTYLAPLTTVGNLPFRRVCIDYGADITCGEMGLATSFLTGSKEEWSLVRRHPSEKIFGVQVAGNKPNNLVPTAEILAKELGGGTEGIDFVDLNCGCPIDLVFKSGSGSALLDTAGRLGKILIGMNKALGDIPLTIKLRTGVKDGKNTAHKLMPRLSTEWSASCITLHGRTRQQRYSRLADWDYIKTCVNAVREKEKDEDLPPVPIFGGGDCFSSADYWEKIDTSGVDGIMIGRGALIKPWIFTEVKERREWDISPIERLEGIRKYAEYGLNHFGSDTTGVNATRRYLCEALSFQYRYVPIGLLETLPGRINDRAPNFRGRNELETLLASPDSNDWVKISEMFLGAAPEMWSFTPKHKSNAYGSEEGQG